MSNAWSSSILCSGTGRLFLHRKSFTSECLLVTPRKPEKAEEFLKERSLSSYYDEVALKGLQLAQADAERGALDHERLTKVRDAVREFANDLSDQDDRPPPKV